MNKDWKSIFPQNNRYFETKNGILYKGDSLEIINKLPNEYFDLIITDPPYNASNSALSFRDKHYISINKKWDKNFKIDFYNKCVTLLKKGGQMQIFCSYHLLGKYLQQQNKLKLQQILHYITKNPVPGFMKVYAFSVEYILWFIKKGKPYTFNKKFRFSYKNVFEININGWKQTKHPTEKNLDVVTALIQTHSNPGDLILDCFAGSGTMLIAAEKTNRKWIGIERNKEYCDMIVDRFNKEL